MLQFALDFHLNFKALLDALTDSFAGLMLIPVMLGCTRAVYRGLEDLVITGRTMDWLNDMKSNIWVFPRGIERDGAAGANSIRWTSKYGSVGVSGWDVGIADGMNEEGLFANLLYLVETQYPTSTESRPSLCLSLWAQYILDNFASVKEAVAAIEQNPFDVVPITSPDGKPGTIHLSISDASGDSAIFEYVEGKLIIHHSPDYQVMTNSPIYDKQLALNEYWRSIGGTTMLPGTNRAADRFVRASFYINAIPKTADALEGVAGVFSVIRNASVPMGISTPDQPNISSTLWRTVADHKNKRYFFESVRTPNVFWINLNNLEFTEGSPVKKLMLTDGSIFAGDVSDQFQPTEPMKFLQAIL